MIRAILFDLFGTLLDVHSVAARADQLFPGQGARLS
ncbi:MAG TPA: haloacid dehalogenase, partial [Burkholderiaceae bacterium]|nr:haloacid dehalogenase [Burkholderiaceae bacterium]